MKKLHILSLVILLCSVTEAQLIRGYGLKIGGTVANQVWDNSTGINLDPENKLGFNIGAFAEFLDVPFFSVVGEINYVRKTNKDELSVTTVDNPEGTGEIRDYETGASFLNISLLGKLRTNLVLLSPYIIAGPKIDITLDKINDFDMPDSFNSELIGMKAGIGTEINLVAVTLLAEFIYDFNFNPLYDSDFLEIKTSSFDFRIGVYF
ncbi:MAG: outer membrane beta-barrel protein [Ignavibacteriaceae bacterium]